MKKEKGVFHLFIIRKLKKSITNYNGMIKRKQLKLFLANYRIPRKDRNKVIRGLVKQGMIRIKDKQNIELLE